MAASSSAATATLASSVSTTASVATPPAPRLASAGGAGDAGGAGEEGGGNPVTALVGFVKDQLVRMKDGTVEMYSNHKECNHIRSKQKLYAESIGLAKRTPTTGGITYRDYDFLQKGKDDRGKVGSLLFMMFFAPNFLPYAIMFNPGMMPSSFKTPPRAGVEETRWEKISRQRTHSVVKTMLDLERSARVAPTLSKMNPFGGAKTRRLLEKMDRLSATGGTMLAAQGVDGLKGGSMVLEALKDHVYTRETPSKKELQLVDMPKPLMRGLANVIEAESPPSSFLPLFLVRGSVINHLQKVAAADEFLVNQKVDLDTIADELLEEACSKRLIGGLGRNPDELRMGLKQWLDDVVVKPDAMTGANGDGEAASGIHYNPNLARAALMAYNAVDGARDSRSSSYLPRLLFQGQFKK